jgi:hypothetical protein
LDARIQFEIRVAENGIELVSGESGNATKRTTKQSTIEEYGALKGAFDF